MDDVNCLRKSFFVAFKDSRLSNFMACKLSARAESLILACLAAAR